MEGMNGQWLGRYNGTDSGTLVIEFDDMGTHYEGQAFAYNDDVDMPGTLALLKTTGKEAVVHLRVELYPIDPRTGDPTTWNQLASLLPNVVFPTYADVDFEFAGETLKVSWKTNIATSGSAEITRRRADAPSEYHPIPSVTNWEKFKVHVSGLEHRRYIFRGQDKPARLRTSFHRTGRSDLVVS